MAPASVKRWIDERHELFSRFIGRPLCVRLNDAIISTGTKLQAVIPAKVTNILNPPDKRPGEKGSYTPPCFVLVFDQGSLVFAVEDTNVSASRGGGLQFAVGGNYVTIEDTNEDYRFA